jgi:hypothetical protein
MGGPWHVKRPDTSRAAGGTDGEEEKISRCAVAGRGGESMDSSALKRPHRTAGWLPAAVGRSVAGSPRPEPGGVARWSAPRLATRRPDGWRGVVTTTSRGAAALLCQHWLLLPDRSCTTPRGSNHGCLPTRGGTATAGNDVHLLTPVVARHCGSSLGTRRELFTTSCRCRQSELQCLNECKYKKKTSSAWWPNRIRPTCVIFLFVWADAGYFHEQRSGPGKTRGPSKLVLLRVDKPR